MGISTASMVRALRLPFATATLITVIYGAVFSWVQTGTFDWLAFILVLMIAVLVHLASNVANDYYDSLSGADERNVQITPFSGGSRVIQERVVSQSSMKMIFSFLFALSGVGLALLVWYTNYVMVLGIGVLGMLLGIMYTKPPFKLSYRGLGELTIGITFGLLAPLFTSVAQTGSISWISFVSFSPFFFTIVAIILINEFPDRPSDLAAKKKTLVVLLGITRSFRLYALSLLIPFGIVIGLVFFDIVGVGSLLVVLLIPVALALVQEGLQQKEKYDRLIPVNAKTIQFHLLFGILYSLGVGLSVLL